jgi:hypothetical protein
MNDNYKNYNIIPIGDHCAISLIFKDLGLRNKSYPFDWNSHTDVLYNTNIIYNIKIIDSLKLDNISHITEEYIGDALVNINKINTKTNINFPHELGNSDEIIKKYERRFERLYLDLNNKTNLFILLTRYFYIDENNFEEIRKILFKFNNDNKILFISGTNHIYFEEKKYDNVIFKHINYDISKCYAYDYDVFRPYIKKYLQELLL